MRRLGIIALLIASSAFAQQQQHPNVEKGVAPNKMYQFGDIDSVNLFSGNVMIRLPIGQSYPVGPSFGYQLMLSYNSKLWDFEPYVIHDSGTNTDTTYTIAYPDRASNAGFGWNLSLGRLIPVGDPNGDGERLIYVDPSGNQHGFGTYLHYEPPDQRYDCSTSGARCDPLLNPGLSRVLYSGGSYLRMKIYDSGMREVEFPSGEVHSFNTAGRLVAGRDAFGNSFNISYLPNAVSELINSWTLTDSHGREQTVTYKDWDNGLKNYKKVLETITFSAFSESSDPNVATYSFDYGTANEDIPRGCGNDYTGPGFGPNAAVPLLKSVTLPDGSKYSFTYHMSSTPCAASCVMGGNCEQGTIASIQFPTGGKRKFEYQQYETRLPSCAGIFLSNTPGIRSRSDYRVGATTPDATWTYGVSTNSTETWPKEACVPSQPGVPPPGPGETEQADQEMQVAVIAPSGRKSIHYFSVWPRIYVPSTAGFHPEHYGYPFTSFSSKKSGDRNLSVEEYDGAVLKRSSYVSYDGLPPAPVGIPRVIGSRTAFHDDLYVDPQTPGDDPHYIDAASSDYDGYGHLRTSVTTSSLPGTSPRTVTTRFNPLSTANGRIAGGAALLIDVDDDWLLETYDRVTTQQGDTNTVAEFCFDSTGFLAGRRAYKNPGSVTGGTINPVSSENDVVTSFTKAGGFMASERWFGGDARPLPSDYLNLCSAPTTTQDYGIDYTYSYGTLRTATYQGMTWKATDRDIDPHTGLVWKSRDSSGVETKFLYDTSGRLTNIQPTGRAWTEYSHSKALGIDSPATFIPGSFFAKHCAAGTTACAAPLTETHTFFDDFGRVVQTKNQMAAGWSTVRNLHDASGRVTSTSMPEYRSTGDFEASFVAAHVTGMTYDIFDRAKSVTAPDQSRTLFDYIGARSVKRTNFIALTTGSDDTPVTTTETYDAQGRLVAVEEPSGTPSDPARPETANVKTSYDYDVANHLTKVETTDFTVPSHPTTDFPAPPHPHPHQLRTFTYDVRGFLKEESNPEKTEKTYCRGYDARGHLLRKQEGTSTKYDLTFSYDKAERLTKIEATSSGEAIKEFEFDSANGRLLKAIRHNRTASLGNIKVVDNYTYDTAGRVSNKETHVYDDEVPGPTFTQDFTYTDLGQPNALRNPTCTGCGAANKADRNIPLAYSYGLLTSVQGFTPDNGITYWPNGMIQSVVHQGSSPSATTTDTQAQDPHGMMRPASIEFTGYCAGPTLAAPAPASKTVIAGGPVEFSIAEVPGATYQWYKGARGVITAPVPGQTSRTLHIDHLNESATYWVRVTGADGCSSDSATVSANLLICDASVLNIELQPKSTFTPAGGSVSLIVAVSGSDPRYQWHEGISGDASRPVNGATSATLNLSSVTVRTNYWVRVSNAGGCSIDSATATVEICAPPVITVQPTSQAGIAAAGETSKVLTTSVTASGVSLQYAWYEATLDANGLTVVGSQVANQSGPSFSQTITRGSTTWPAAKSYVVKVTDTGTVNGCKGPTTSNIFSFSVASAGECIRLIASPGDHMATPASPNFVLSVRVEGEGDGPFHYKWFHGINGQSSPLPNAPDAPDVTTGIFGGYDAYWCVITSEDCPGVSVTTPKSYAHAWNVCPLPPVSVVPPRFDAAIGSGVTPTFTAYVDWPRVSYQWYIGQSGDTSVPVPNGTQATVSPGQVVTTMYWVRVTNECGTSYEDSQTVLYSVGGCEGVFIGAHPQSVNSAAGAPATLRVAASSSSSSLYYNWFKQGSTTPEPAHTATITVFPTETTTWYAAVSNQCFGANTLPATVHIRSCSTINIGMQPQGGVIHANAPVTKTISVTATPTTGTLSYQWYQGESGDTSVVVANGTTSSIQVSPTQTTSYWVRITSTINDLPACRVDSDTAVIKWCVPPSFPTQVLGGSIRANDYWVLHSTAVGTDLTNKWRLGSQNGEVVSTDADYWARPPVTTTYVLEVTSGCSGGPSLFSDPIVVTVCTIPNITAQPQNKLVFPGKTAQLHVSASEANDVPLTYRWEDENGTTVGTNSPDFTTPPITAEKRYLVHVQAGVCGIDSEQVTVSFCTLPEVIGSGVTLNVAPQQNVTLHLPFTATSGNNYAWYRGPVGNTSNPVGTNSYDYSFFAAASGEYWATVTSPDGCVSRSTPYIVNVCVPSITQQPASILLSPPATSVPLSVTASPATVYQWYIGEKGDITTPVSGGTTATINVSPASDTRYWVRVTGSCGLDERGAPIGPVDSESALVTRCVPPAITQTTAGPWIARGSSFGIGVAATGMNLTYQWYTGTSGNTSAPIAGATGSNYTAGPQNTTSYWVRVTGTCGSVDSTTITVSVCATPVITAQPQSTSIFSGSAATLSVTASQATTSPMSYQWYRGASGDTSIPAGTSATYTTPALMANTNYWVRVSCGTCTPADSQTATVSMCPYAQTIAAPPNAQAAIGQVTRLTGASVASGNSYRWYRGASGDLSTAQTDWQSVNYIDVNPAVTTQYWYRLQNGACISSSGTVTVSVCVPTITTQPASVMINPGASTTLSVVANTSGLTYQWYTGTSGTITSPIGGATGASITVSPTAATNYWVRVTSSCARTADSVTAAVTICQPPAITQTTASPWIARGSSFTIGVVATGTNLTYQWYTGTSGNTSAPIGGATGANYTAGPQNTTSYWVRVSGTCGSVNSATITVSVCATPGITAQPQNVSIFSGSTATLSVTATQATTSPMSYQWYRGASGDTSVPVGTNAATFTTPALTANTNYWVRISCGTCAPADSQTATVSICPYPQIVTSSGDVQTTVGQLVRLSTVSGGGNSYSWYRGAAGDTTNPLSVGSPNNYLDVAPTVTTQYWAQVTTGTCVSRTNTITVSVCVPQITQQPQSVTIASGASTTLTSAANTAGVTFRWYIGTSGNTTSPITGATNPTLTVTPTATTNYWVRATSTCARTVDSATATVTLCSPPVITSQPVNVASYAGGYNVSVSVQATGSNLTYQWYIGESGNTSTPVGNRDGATGGTTNTLTYSPISITTRVWARITGQCGSVNSNAAWVSVIPTIGGQPQSQVVSSGSTASVTVYANANGSALHYQWKNAANGAVIPGSGNSNRLVLTSVTAPINVYCAVTSGAATVYSNAAEITLCSGPTVTASWVPNGSCRYIMAQINGEYSQIEWYAGQPGDTSQYWGASTAFNFCPTAPTTFWARVYGTDPNTSSACNADSAAVTVSP